jgi:hypothetical protein
MRYAKGSFVISSQSDIPLLLQVRNSRFITHQQLFEFMQFGDYEYSRKSFNWRVKRLMDFECISVCEGNFGRGMRIYRISRNGLMHLESYGHFATTLNSKAERLPDLAYVYHALELNSIHLALMAGNVLARWQSDVETASKNIISRAPLAKDYDAIVYVWHDDNMACFALEYERTLKSAQQYSKIRRALEAEANIPCVLYLAAGMEIAHHLADQFSGIPKRLGFGTAADFRKRLLDTEVLTDSNQSRVTFRRLLGGIF